MSFTAILHVSTRPAYEETIRGEFDLSIVHEIATGGETITGAALFCLFNGQVVTDLTIGSITIGAGSGGLASSAVQFLASATPAAKIGNRYLIECDATLSLSANPKIEGFWILIAPPDQTS